MEAGEGGRGVKACVVVRDGGGGGGGGGWGVVFLGVVVPLVLLSFLFALCIDILGKTEGILAVTVFILLPFYGVLSICSVNFFGLACLYVYWSW